MELFSWEKMDVSKNRSSAVDLAGVLVFL